MHTNRNFEEGYSFIKYRSTLITERGNDRPWLIETGWITEFESSGKNLYDDIILIPEEPRTAIIDAICTFEFKYYINCSTSCNKLTDNYLDITKKGACEHLLKARKEFISRGEDYYIIENNRATKHNSANYNIDFQPLGG